METLVPGIAMTSDPAPAGQAEPTAIASSAHEAIARGLMQSPRGVPPPNTGDQRPGKPAAKLRKQFG